MTEDTIVLYRADNGHQYHLHGGRGMGLEGITLLVGPSGIDQLQHDLINLETARRPGARYIDRTTKLRDLDLPVLIDGKNSHSKYLARKNRFLQDLNLGGMLCFYTKRYGWRWTRIVLEEVSTGWDYDPAKNDAITLDLKVVAHDPRYYSRTQVTEYLLRSDATSVTVTNHGDFTIAPIFYITGTPNQEITLVMPNGDPVKIPKFTSVNEQLLITTDKARQSVLSTKRGRLPWRDAGYRKVECDVKPGETKQFILKQSLPGTQATLELFVPVMHISAV